jgi:protein-S-isoprenylcysteine O-methyltransferase Ste14
VLFCAAWIAAAALHRICPIRLAHSAAGRRRVAGAVLAGAGAALSSTVVRRFAAASTPVSPLRPARALVVDGPYRYSRNPDYVGQTLLYAGSSILRNRLWPLLLLPSVLAIITHAVIRREERYLNREFGAAYRHYAERVPRWL